MRERERERERVSYPVQFVDRKSDLILHQLSKPTPYLFESAVARHCSERSFEGDFVI